MALCNVLQFFVNTGDKRLSSIIVKGERIFQQDEGNSLSIKFNYSGTLFIRSPRYHGHFFVPAKQP